MKKVIMKSVAALGLCCGLTSVAVAGAEITGHQDTDLFMTNPNLGGRPNVLVVVDNSANWSSADDGSSKFDYVKQSLYSVLSGLDENAYNIGILFMAESNNKGAYPRYAIQEIDATAKTELLGLIGDPSIPAPSNCVDDDKDGIDEPSDSDGKWEFGLHESCDKGSGAYYALSMHEAYLYFNDLEARVGADESKRDYDAFTPADSTGSQYNVLDAEVCVDNYVIFVSNGSPDNGENSDAETLLDGLGGNTNVIQLEPSGRQDNWLDEYARFMAEDGIYTFTIDVRPETTGQGPSNSALLQSAANEGKGTYYAVQDATELEVAILDALNQIQAVNNVFAATSLPVSVNARGTHLNEVYMAVFRPDATAAPKWTGNLKLYQFALNDATGNIFLADKNGNEAQNPVTGFLRNTSHSFWTTDSSYWDYEPRGNPASGSDAPDGEIVEKGGVAQQIRESYDDTLDGGDRTLYTCAGGCINGIMKDFDTGNTGITQAALGVDSSLSRDALINWVRGDDNTFFPERAAGEVRPYIHGDVVHSSPAVVNYNRTGNDNDIVVFYGANDGLLRAVKGGKATADGGSELWGFIPEQVLGQLKRLRDNTDDINTPSIPGDPDNKPYLVDGNISTYVHDSNGDGQIHASDGDKVWLFVTVRRGGRFIFAMDVSDPADPRMLWQKESGDDGFGEMGQSWSDLTVRRIGYSTNPSEQQVEEKIVLVAGAGYDAAAEDPYPAGTAGQGRGIFIIDAETGEMLWQAGPEPSGGVTVTVADMMHSIPSAVSAIDRDGDGITEKLYVGDTGGNVWRVDLDPNTEMSGWQVHRLASLDTGGTDSIKFLHAPSVVKGEDENGVFHAVLLGSGDREKPFETSVQNRFFMLKDYCVETTGDCQATITVSDLYDATENLIQDGTESQQEIARAALASSKGWYIDLLEGEKVVGSSEARSGSVFFATNQPTLMVDEASCDSNLGTARTYVISYLDASATYDRNDSGEKDIADRTAEAGTDAGYLPNPTYAIVDLGNGPKEVVCFGPECESPETGALNTRIKEYWYQDID